MNSKTLGAIDIGSNAIRLLISNIDNVEESIEFKKVAFVRVPIRLGEDSFSTGKISGEKLYLFNEAMSGFSHIMKAYKVSKFLAYATSAMREAENGKDVIEHIYKNTGIDIQIITGKEEAEVIFKAGGLDAVMDKGQNYLYVDVGGGSTELILYSNQEKVDSSSFKIGTVRMLQNKVSTEEKNNLKLWLQNIANTYAPINIIASGGNINKVFKLLSKKEKETISYNDIKTLYNKLKVLSYDQRMEKYKLNTYRADVIIPALKIFLTIGKICSVQDIYVPKVGLVDGIVHHLSSLDENKL